MLKRELLQTEEVIHSERFWKTDDGAELYFQTWNPTKTPVAIINLIHGLGEHSSRWEAWAQKFVSEGFLVRSFDQRGHGKSSGRRGHAQSYDQLLKDIDTFIQQGRAEYEKIPWFLYGHSLGGNLAINYLLKFPQTMQGAIITSPWLELVNKPSSILMTIVSYLSRILPGMLTDNRLKVESLSRDLRVVHNYKNDPLVHNRISLRMFRQYFDAGLQAAISIYKINIPLLVMHGAKDGITSCKASANFVRNSSSKTTYIEWEEGYHELHNDLDHELVFKSISHWLKGKF